MINGLDLSHQTSKSLRYSKILLKCVEYEPNNYRLIYFTTNYLSEEYRVEFLNIICRTFTDNIDILKVIIREIRLNEKLYHEQFLDTIIDGLQELNDNIEDAIECIMELIDRMKKISDENWKHILRLKQKILFKLVKKDYSRVQTRILVAKLIVRYGKQNCYFSYLIEFSKNDQGSSIA